VSGLAELPKSLVRDPFPLQVVAADGTTPSTTGSSVPVHGPSVTQVFTRPSTVPATTPGEDPRTPHEGDFSGSLSASATSVTAGDGVDLTLSIRNITDHEIQPSLGSLSKSVAIVCASDLSPLGHTGAELLTNENMFYVTAPATAPGDPSGRGGSFRTSSADIGAVTCEGVIVATNGHWADGSVSSVARLTNVPSVTFQVVAPTAVTTPPTISSTSVSTSAP